MQTSIFIAKLMGPFLLVSGAGMLIDAGEFKAVAQEFVKSRALIYIAGFLALAMGLAIVVTHNVWTFGWPVIITLFGWLAVAAGIMRMTFPGRLSNIGAGMLERKGLLLAAAIGYVVLGGILTVKGYGLV